jgi:murein DD-endopeptidase MepM/ murein hydrolase activator NlpD
MLRRVICVTGCVSKAAVGLGLLLVASCTDMGPTPETYGIVPSNPLPVPMAKPTPPTMPQSELSSAIGRGNSVSTRELGDFHRVNSGETVYGVARQHGVDAYDLVSLNKLTPPFDLFEGQRLRIPGRGVAPPAVAAAPATRPAETRPAGVTPRTTEALPPPPATAGTFIWPVEGRVISDFGAKGGGRFNDGINIAAPEGAAVRAAGAGVVAYSGNELRGFGNMLLIKHAGGWVTAYAHNQELLVNRGDTVDRGQVIARVGSTGGVDQPQLHFELRKGKKAVDPLDYLRRPSASAAANREPG